MPQSSIIDWHSHFFPPAFAALLRARDAAPYVRPAPDGQGELLYILDEPRPFPTLYHDPETRLRSLDKAGIGRQVICWPGLDILPVEQALPLSRAYNDSAAELARAHPGRFSGLASLPLEDPALAAAELERARGELGLLGAVVPSEIFASEPVARRYLPLLEAAQRTRSHLFVHPRFVPGPGEAPLLPPGIDHSFLRIANLVVQDRLSAAYFTLALTPLLNPYPDITVHLANLGGSLPFVVERFEAGAAHNDGTPLLPRLRRVYVDVSSFGPRAIGLVHDVLGADRLLLGTDQPVFPAVDRVDALQRTNISEADRRLILENMTGRPFPS